MKKLTTLLLAAGMIFAASAPASAVDVKMDGQYLFNFITGERVGTGQNFDEAGQRLRLGMTFTANENLSGYFQVQVGTGVDSTSTYDWGSDPSGNSTKIGMRQAYVDWVIPQTAVKVRMGRQLIGLPEDAFGKNAVMHPGWQGRDGIVVSAPVTDWLDLTAFWLRGGYDSINSYDTDQSNKSDFFAAMGAFKFDGFSFTPYVMYGSLDASDGVWNDSASMDEDGTITWPGYGAGNTVNTSTDGTKILADGNAFWVGSNFVMSYFDPFVLKISGAYGTVSYDAASDGKNYQDRNGWYVQAKASYKTAYGTPIFGGWYGSGDDNDAQYKGQGWIPAWAGRFHPTFGYSGGEFALFDTTTRHNIAGTWGLQAGIEDVSFLQDLTHKFTVTWFQGTNDKNSFSLSENPYTYMTDNDNVVEFNLASTYQIYKNLTVCLELAYMITDYSDGDHRTWADANETDKDGWSTALSFQYMF